MDGGTALGGGPRDQYATVVDRLASRLAAAAVGLGADPTGGDLPDDWRGWQATMFPEIFYADPADHHVELWEWVWSIRRGRRPPPYVGIWARGGGKSSNAQGASLALGLRGVRRYGWYVSETQPQANDKLADLATMLESPAVARYYPQHADRAVGKYGHSKGWRRERLHTAGGFLMDAIGLDTASRGKKHMEQRPDFMVLDDLDGKHDSPAATRKKIEQLTTSLLPAGDKRQLAVLACQNLIIPHGIFSRMNDGRAEWLIDRVVSGPHPAIRDLETRVDVMEDGRRRSVVVSGTPTWPDGQSLADCQNEIDTFGLPAFKQEAQHDVATREGALWTPDMIVRADRCPILKRAGVGVDPSGGSAEIGMVTAGLGHDGIAYVFRDDTVAGERGPQAWGDKAVDVYDDEELDRILAERNFGGDMVESNIRASAGDRVVNIDMVHASRGKAVRADPVANLYAQGLVRHVGVFAELEAEMTGWAPGDKWSPNRLDALVWVLTWLLLSEPGKRGGSWSSTALRKRQGGTTGRRNGRRGR